MISRTYRKQEMKIEKCSEISQVRDSTTLLAVPITWHQKFLSGDLALNQMFGA